MTAMTEENESGDHDGEDSDGGDSARPSAAAVAGAGEAPVQYDPANNAMFVIDDRDEAEGSDS